MELSFLIFGVFWVKGTGESSSFFRPSQYLLYQANNRYNSQSILETMDFSNFTVLNCFDQYLLTIVTLLYLVQNTSQPKMSFEVTLLFLLFQYWGNTICVQSTVVNDGIVAAVEKAIVWAPLFFLVFYKKNQFEKIWLRFKDTMNCFKILAFFLFQFN